MNLENLMDSMDLIRRLRYIKKILPSYDVQDNVLLKLELVINLIEDDLKQKLNKHIEYLRYTIFGSKYNYYDANNNIVSPNTGVVYTDDIAERKINLFENKLFKFRNKHTIYNYMYEKFIENNEVKDEK